jgi:hypothetical protein
MRDVNKFPAGHLVEPVMSLKAIVLDHPSSFFKDTPGITHVPSLKAIVLDHPSRFF